MVKMRTNVKIGILRESKVPPDTRVPLTPTQCVAAMREYPTIELVVQSSNSGSTVVKPSQGSGRCFTDDDYKSAGVEVVENVGDCDILIGVKEVKPSMLIPGKTYLFFSHTVKAQAHNRGLLREILARGIRLVDFELLVDDESRRVIAFGRWAGIVGAHNALFTWAKRSNIPNLPRMHSIVGGYEEAKRLYYPNFADRLKGLRVVLIGDGRVSSGCVEVLEACGVRKLSPEAFCSDMTISDAVYCQLPADKLYGIPKSASRRNGYSDGWDWNEAFFQDPTGYESRLMPYLQCADVLINGIYWDRRTAPLFTIEDMKDPSYRVKVISDITCDLAPDSSIPATLKATTISDPIFWFDPFSGDEVEDTNEERLAEAVWMTTIDNLPNELACDSSNDFGEALLRTVLPELLLDGEMIHRATIADAGHLQPNFAYLQSYVDGN